MARSLRSLRQVATLMHGHMACRFAPAFRVLGVCEQLTTDIEKFICFIFERTLFRSARVSQSDCRELYMTVGTLQFVEHVLI